MNRAIKITLCTALLAANVSIAVNATSDVVGVKEDITNVAMRSIIISYKEALYPFNVRSDITIKQLKAMIASGFQIDTKNFDLYCKSVLSDDDNIPAKSKISEIIERNSKIKTSVVLIVLNK